MYVKKPPETLPTPPIFDQILEDLREADLQGFNLPNPSEVLCVATEIEDDQDDSLANKHYETIKKLVEDRSRLEDSLQHLREVHSELKIQADELKKLVDSLTKEAVKALE